MSGNSAATLPIPSAPVVDPNGQVTPVWRYFFLQLLNRTGGTSGIPIIPVAASVIAVQAQEAMDDVTFPPPGPALSMDDVLGEMQQAAPRVVFAMEAVVEELPGKSQVNPLIAALLVSDASIT